jgi:hypothetical protein
LCVSMVVCAWMDANASSVTSTYIDAIIQQMTLLPQSQQVLWIT